MIKLTLSVTTSDGSSRTFTLGEPVSVSRSIYISTHSQAFSLPNVTSIPFEIKKVFIGDVQQGGSCNVDILSFTPHNLTHLETSAHILNQKSSQATVKDIPANRLSGITFLADISEKTNKTGTISAEFIQTMLKAIDLPISSLAVKTKASSLLEHFDFSDQNFLALSEEAARVIHDFQNGCIKNLILDLPSADPEKDNGQLLAHRAFFGLPNTGIEFIDHEFRVLCELAYFKNLVQQYYYFITTPAKIASNAMITDIVFFPLLELS